MLMTKLTNIYILNGCSEENRNFIILIKIGGALFTQHDIK